MLKSKNNREKFDYDGEQWANIEKCVRDIRSNGLSDEERTHLRDAAIEYLQDKKGRESGGYVSPRQQVKSWKNVALMCNDVRAELENALMLRHGASWRNALDHPVDPLEIDKTKLTFRKAIQFLAELQRAAEEYSKPFWWGVSIMKSLTGRLDPTVVYLQNILLQWKEFGGELRFSQNPVSRKISGPLARFINDVTVPVMGQDAPSPKSYRSLINRQKKLYQKLESLPVESKKWVDENYETCACDRKNDEASSQPK